MMKRQRKLAISIVIVAAGFTSGYWVSSMYGSRDVLGSDESSAWHMVRQVSKGGGSSLMMPFFDYRKGP